MGILSNRRMIARIRGYPDRLMRMQSSYGKIVETASTILVNPQGNLARELAVFKEKLQAIRLALSACLYYGESLKSDINMDISALESNLVVVNESEINAIKSTILTLETELATTEKTMAECRSFSQFLQEVICTLRIIKEERGIVQLIKLENDLAERTKKGG